MQVRAFAECKLHAHEPLVGRAGCEGGAPLKPLHRLVDVFFYESHNNAPTMRAYWTTSGLSYGLNDSYSIFMRLRELGVQAHSWI